MLCDSSGEAVKKNKRPEHLYNVDTGTDVTIKQLAATIQKIVGHTGTNVWDSSKPNGTPPRKLIWMFLK